MPIGSARGEGYFHRGNSSKGKQIRLGRAWQVSADERPIGTASISHANVKPEVVEQSRTPTRINIQFRHGVKQKKGWTRKPSKHLRVLQTARKAKKL